MNKVGRPVQDAFETYTRIKDVYLCSCKTALQTHLIPTESSDKEHCNYCGYVVVWNRSVKPIKPRENEHDFK